MDSIVTSGKGVAHAAEFEASFGYAAFPENVHWEEVDYEKTDLKIKSESYAKEDPAAFAETRDLARGHKGRVMINEAINWVSNKMATKMNL
jgi:creatinine amidohydrolase/Fe(II)-dependent formamide hydrolase-like protein